MTKQVIAGFGRRSKRRGLMSALSLALLLCAGLFARVLAWTEDDFVNRPLIAYPRPAGHDDIIGQLESYTIQKGDTLLDVGRWYGLSAKEISDANGHMDWWRPPAGTQVVLPTEHILPNGERKGIILNIPEMRIYYYPVSGGGGRHKGKVIKAAYVTGKVVYTFPVGLGRFDWKTPAGKFTVRGKTRNPTWVVPKDIYLEHLERDGEAEHVIRGGRDDNPLGLYRIELTLPEYALHGTDVPWGVGMTVSHGCVRLYPEDIERLFNKVRIGTPGAFIYQPVKFGFRGDALYVEVHDDLYGRYPGLWSHATKQAQQLNLTDRIDYAKLEKAVEAKTGIPTYVGLGSEPDTAVNTAAAPSSTTAPAPIVAAGSTATGSATAPEAPTAPTAEASGSAEAGSDGVESASGPARAPEVGAAAPAAEATAGAEAVPLRVEDVGSAGTAPEVGAAAPAAEATAGAEAVPLRVEDAGSAGTAPEAPPPTVSIDESPSGEEAAPAKVKHTGEAEEGSSEAANPTTTDEGAGAGSDKKTGALKDSGGGLPTGVVEEPEGTDKTASPATP